MSERATALAVAESVSNPGVAPVKPAPFDLPQIPVYFWIGGIAAGSWLAATAEEWSGGEDREVVRAGRYLTLGSVLGGTALLIWDLGRPERFLHMLRVVRARSPMSIGSWALALFGGYAGLGVVFQMAEDGWLGDHPRLARFSSGWVGKAAHLLGAPAAMFVGSYTGVLLAATSTPSWAARSRVLPALFTASATASGLAAVQGSLEVEGGTRAGTARRLAQAQSVALGTELALEMVDVRRARSLPSADGEPATTRMARWAGIALGVALPLALSLREATRKPPGDPEEEGERPRRRSGARLLAAGLALAGSMTMRWLTVEEGMRSAATPEDTWQYAGNGRKEATHGPA